jgi:aryl-alcohol dehydrogenase-like predicted oxidoreductase
VLRRAIEIGVTLIDTADAYGPEVNEQFIAETLHPYPEELVIATKGGLTRHDPEPGRTMGVQNTCVPPATGASDG